MQVAETFDAGARDVDLNNLNKGVNMMPSIAKNKLLREKFKNFC